MLTWNPPPATGLGDRMGGWMVLFALGWLRNETVWLNWAPGWFRLPARIAADSQAALECISFPDFVRLSVVEGESLRSVPLGVRSLGFAPKPKPGVSVSARVRGGFNSIPHLMYSVWNRTQLLEPSRSGWRDYVRAYHRVGRLVQVRDACAPPAASRPPEVASPRLRIYVHLRRTDRGGEDDVRLGGAKGRGVRTRFEAQTHRAIRTLLDELTLQLVRERTAAAGGGAGAGASVVEWTVMSDSEAHARATMALIANASSGGGGGGDGGGGRGRGGGGGEVTRSGGAAVTHAARLAPANFSTWNFFSFARASGIVQSCIRDGWSSYSSIPALMWDVPLYSVHAAVPEKYAAMGHYLPPDMAPDERLVYAQPDAPAFVRRMLAANPPTATPASTPTLPMGGARSARVRGGRGRGGGGGGGRGRGGAKRRRATT